MFQRPDQAAYQHIQDKLIEAAKEKLSGTALSVSEIAFLPGFEHSQSFSRLFKLKTNFTPIEYRGTLN
ncbi:helix-turn-helix domain-containing protein [Algoriphagus sp. Y33]|uniref:helix-turn-helix domain-containing protein n=1 Tax=Algoriphagus sp. Y33 TaxID=2772483 RepID=UPI00177DE9BE